jgi:hypothetical protein
MALRSDSSGDFANRTSGGFVTLTNFSVCFWARREALTDNGATFWAVGGPAESPEHYLTFYDGVDDGHTFLWEQFGGEQVGTLDMAQDVWYFIALTRAGTGANQTIAYNRTASASSLTSASATFPGTNGISREFIHANPYNTAITNRGSIANLMRFSAVLSAAELLAQSYQYLPIRTANLHAWQPFGDNSVAGCMIDYSGNGRSLTANGTLLTADGPPISWGSGARRIFIPAAVAGGSVALNGVIAGRSPSQAALSIVRAMTGRAQAQGRIAGAASALRPLTGNVAGRTRSDGSSSIIRALAGRIMGRSSVQGAAGALRSLTTAIAGRSSAIGNFTTSAVIDLVGRIAGRSSVQASLSIIRNLSGSISSKSSARGAASIVRNLMGRVSARSTAQSAAGALRSLSSVIRATSTARLSFPPLVEQVVGIVRALLRASMRIAPIIAPMKIRVPIVVNAVNMIAKNVTLKDYVIGDDTEIAFQLTDWPAGVVLAKAYFTMKESLNDGDADAIIQREITISLSAEGQITANGTSGTAEGYFLIRHQDSEWSDIRPRQPYQFDIQPITDQSTVQTPIIGTISFQKGATDAAS